MKPKIVVYAQDETSFSLQEKHLRALGFQAPDVLFCDSRRQSRSAVINQNLGQWLFFIDHDCFLNQETLAVLEKLVGSLKRNTVFAGCYADSLKSSHLQRVHNFIANTWLEQSYEAAGAFKLLLGGVFLIYCEHAVDEVETGVWGAEDKLLAYELNQKNFSFTYEPKLQVVHLTTKKWDHFLKRACVHGCNEARYIAENKNIIKYLFWIRKVGFVNLHFLPAIGLHFCIQKMAKQVQKIRRSSMLKK